MRPYFEELEGGSLFELQVGEEWHFEIPKAVHPSDLPVTLKPFELGLASSFMEYNALKHTFDIGEGLTTRENVGIYPIILQLIDSDGLTGVPLTIIVSI